MGVTRIPRIVKQPSAKVVTAPARMSLGPKAAVAIPGAAPAAKHVGFTLRFGEGKVQEWDGQELAKSEPAAAGTVSMSSRVAIGVSSSSNSSDNEEDQSSSSEPEDEKDVPAAAPMGVTRIPRIVTAVPKSPSPPPPSVGVSSSSPLFSSSPRKAGIGINLRLPPSVTKDGSSRGSTAAAAAAAVVTTTSEIEGSPGPSTLPAMPNLHFGAKDRTSSPVLSKQSSQLSARYEQQPGMGARPATHFSTIKVRPSKEGGGGGGGNLSSMFGDAAGPSTNQRDTSFSLDSVVHEVVEVEGSGSLTARDLLGETRVLVGERSKIKSFTRLFAAPLWGEKEDPIRSKLLPVRWAKVKVKDVLALLLKEKEASVASLPGTKSFANPMALKSLQVEGGESSSSDESLPPKSPNRMRSPLSPKPVTSSPRLEKLKEALGRSPAVVPTLSVPSKAEQQQHMDSDKKSRMASGERLRQESGLSALQNELRNTDGPNRIDMLVAEAKSKEKQQKKKVDAASLFVRSDEYEKRRSDNKLYVSSELHVSMLTLLLDLMTTEIGTLDPLYVSQARSGVSLLF